MRPHTPIPQMRSAADERAFVPTIHHIQSGRPLPSAHRSPERPTTDRTAEPYLIPVETLSGAVVPAEFWVRTDQVEVWHHRQHEGTLHRTMLFSWLTQPVWAMPVMDRNVMFLYGITAQITLSLSDVHEFPLSRQQVAELRHRLRS